MSSPPNSPSSPPASHSVEIEHRLTRMELKTEGHDQKLSLHEKAILGLAGGLYVLAQERLPQIAAVIRGMLWP